MVMVPTTRRQVFNHKLTAQGTASASAEEASPDDIDLYVQNNTTDPNADRETVTTPLYKHDE